MFEIICNISSHIVFLSPVFVTKDPKNFEGKNVFPTIFLYKLEINFRKSFVFELFEEKMDICDPWFLHF